MKTIPSWSSGKDSAWSLHVLRAKPDIEVVGLLTTVNSAFDRVCMHGTRRTLLLAKARAAGLPLHNVEIPYPCPNEVYGEALGRFVSEAKAMGVEAIAFGDLFLEDIRAYRESKLAGTGLKPLFPLWDRSTGPLAHEMIEGGLKAQVVSVDPRQLDKSFAGRSFDARFLDDLPSGIDPCGERGEFHTFVRDDPMFSSPVPCHAGEVIERDGFVFADVVPDA